MPTPTISVVVASYGRFSHIKRLIESARVALPAASTEIIAVCSDQPDSEKVRWLQSQPDVRYIQADVRAGPRLKSLYYYENLGIKAANCEWVMDINDDITFRMDFYEQLALVEKDYDVILVNEHIGEVGLGPRIPAIGTITRPGQEPVPLYLYDAPIVRKSTFEQIGFLDEKLDWFGKGFDLAMTLELVANCRILRQSQLFLDHTITPEGRTPPHYYRDFSYAADKWMKWCEKNPGYNFTWPW